MSPRRRCGGGPNSPAAFPEARRGSPRGVVGFAGLPSGQPGSPGRGRLDSRHRGNDDCAMVSFPGNDGARSRLRLPFVGLR